jgi:hypothetical protein
VLSVSASGKIGKIMVILKGLKNPPKCPVPRNMVIATAKGGSMNEDLMLRWVKECLPSLTVGSALFRNRKYVLAMDAHGAHWHASIQSMLQQMKIETLMIPKRMTSFAQPLDVGINAPFKAKLRECWEKWIAEGEKNYTPRGMRRRPSWETVFKWVDEAAKSVTPAVISKSFICCGIVKNGEEVPVGELGSRLRALLSPDAEGVTDELQEVESESENEDDTLRIEEREEGESNDDVSDIESSDSDEL